MQFINTKTISLQPVVSLWELFFLLAGVSHVTHIEGASDMIESTGLPAATLLAWIAGLFLIVAGAAMMSGYNAKHAALLLAAYVVLVSLLFHSPSAWAADTSGMQQILFMKNVAIAGGLLFMAKHLKK